MRGTRIWQWAGLLTVATTVMFGISQPAAAASRLDGSHLHQLTREVVTPHLDWAQRLDGGPVKALFIVPRNLAAREVVELAQRIELDYTEVVTAHHGVLAVDDVYNGSIEGTSSTEKRRELLAKLEADYDAIVLANYDLQALPAEAQYKILKKVSDGAGLLINFPRKSPLTKLFEQKLEDWKTIAAGIDMKGLTADQQSRSEEALIKTYRFGKGRLALIDYGTTPGTTGGGPGLCAVESYSTLWQGRYENNMAAVGRSLLWAAGRQLPGAVSLGQYVASTGLPISASGIPADAELAIRVRDAENQLVLEQTFAAARQVTLPLKNLAGGVYYVDWRISKNDRASSFGFQTFDVPLALGAIEVLTDKTSYEPGEPVKVTLRIGKGGKALRVVAHLEDSPYGKIWARQEKIRPADEEQSSLTLTISDMPTIAGRVVCTVYDGETKLGQAATEIFFPQRNREVFSTMVWNSVPEPLARFYSSQTVDNLGWRAGLTHPSRQGSNARLAAILDQRLVPYMTRIGIQEKGGITSNAYFLGVPAAEVEAAGNKTDGSFYNPAIQALWKKAIAARITNLPQYGPLVYNLGDENFFSYDAGYSPSDEKAYREFLKQRHGTIEHLNRQWQTTYASFEDVEHDRPEALRAKGNFAAWFDHRAFVERQYADVHHFLAEQIKSFDPQAKVGAEGSVPGDLELTISKLDFWGPYSNAVMDELLRSIGGDRLRMLWWGGYVGSHGGRDVYPYPLWRPLLQGVVNGNSWYSSAAGAPEGFLGADLRQADYFKQMWPHLKALQEGQAQLLITQPLEKHGIGILWSHASHTASLMDERFFKPTESINAFMQFCYKSGLSFEFLTTSMVQSGGLKDYKVLLLCGASALSDGELEQIESFVRRGGIVIADLKPGVLNGFCSPLPQSSMSELFGVQGLVWSGKLEMLPIDISATMRGERLTLRAARAFQTAGIQPLSVRQVGEGLAVLLNFNLGSAANTASQETPLDEFLASLLRVGGVRPPVRLEGLSGDQLLMRVRQSEDGRTLGMVVPKKEIGREFRIELPEPTYVYEVGGKSLGRQQVITGKADTPFKLYCLFQQEPSKPSIKLSRDRVACGEAAALDVSALAPSGIYQLQILDDRGNPVERRSRVLTGRDLKTPLELRFAFNDAPGLYTVKINDIRTNEVAQLPLEVTSANQR